MSGVSDGEYALLVGNFNRVQGRDHAAELKARGFSKAQIAIALKEASKVNRSQRYLDLNFEEDFKPDYSAFSFIMGLYHPWSKYGVLPFPGSTSEQPSKIMEMFSILDKLVYEQEKADAEEQRRKSKRG